MDIVTFKTRTKHGKIDFHPIVKYGFEDADAMPYFDALGWVKTKATGEAADCDVVITFAEIDIDPETIWGDGPNRGRPVNPEKAQAAQAAREAAGIEAPKMIAGGKV